MSNYARILSNRYHSNLDTGMAGDVDLAFTVVEVLSEAGELTPSWDKLLQAARGLIKTRAKRSRSRFKSLFIKALEASELLVPKVQEEVKPQASSYEEREEKFATRLLDPLQFRKDSQLKQDIKPSDVAPVRQETIITVESKVSFKEREDEFTQRLRSPASFRRGD